MNDRKGPSSITDEDIQVTWRRDGAPAHSLDHPHSGDDADDSDTDSDITDKGGDADTTDR